ncbi:MAG: hypothetical protein M3357_17965, partial [Actinomycetota bacterium]|nr:hypothetical protein [Actinomycetota bacterium]
MAGRARPVILAGERRLVVPGPLGDVLPGGGLQRGTVVAVDGSVGAGGTSLVLALLTAATAAGEWAAAVVDVEGSFGGLAAAETGVALERLAVVRLEGVERFAHVVATLLEGMTVVAATVPRQLRVAEARRLVARARERGSVLVAAGGWPGEAALRLRTEGTVWSGLGPGEGLLGPRTLRVTVAGRGV